MAIGAPKTPKDDGLDPKLGLGGAAEAEELKGGALVEDEPAIVDDVDLDGTEAEVIAQLDENPEAAKIHDAVMGTNLAKYRVKSAFESLGNEAKDVPPHIMLQTVLAESMKPREEGEKTPEVRRFAKTSALINKAIRESEVPVGVHPVGAAVMALSLKNATQYNPATRTPAADLKTTQDLLGSYVDPKNKFGVASWDNEKAKSAELKAVDLLGATAALAAKNAEGGRQKDQDIVRFIGELHKAQDSAGFISNQMRKDGVGSTFSKQTLSGALASLDCRVGDADTTPEKILETLRSIVWTNGNTNSDATHAQEYAHLGVKPFNPEMHQEFKNHVQSRRAEAMEARKMSPGAIEGFTEFIVENKAEVPADLSAFGSALEVPLAYDNTKSFTFRGDNLKGLLLNLAVLAEAVEPPKGKTIAHAKNYFMADATRANGAYMLMGYEAQQWERETAGATE
jgi:hypothetical protein